MGSARKSDRVVTLVGFDVLGDAAATYVEGVIAATSFDQTIDDGAAKDVDRVVTGMRVDEAGNALRGDIERVVFARAKWGIGIG